MAAATEKGLRIRTEVDPELPALLSGDAKKLRHILLNLLGNAVKYSDAGYITLRIKVLGTGQQQIRCRFEVQDEGKGIPPEHQAKLFDPFWSHQNSQASQEASTGLGLSITRQLVELMNGTISMQDAPPHGSLFWFELPLAVPAQTVSLPPPALQDSRSNNTLPQIACRVLLVDDNEINLKVGKLMLEKFGIGVTLASSGEEAVVLCGTQQFDLVLMDVTMRGIPGIEACRQIRQNSHYLKTPIIAWTAHSSDAARDEFIAAGMSDCLIKPIQFSSLSATLERWLVEPRQQHSAA